MGFGHEDFAESQLDLNERFVRHPAATFFMRRGRDILIIDRSLDPVQGSTIVAVEDGELKLRRFEPGKPVELWGVVTYEIRDML